MSRWDKIDIYLTLRAVKPPLALKFQQAHNITEHEILAFIRRTQA